MMTISTKVLKGCCEIDMSVILFPQSNITARWSADLNLTSPQEEEGGELIFGEIVTASVLPMQHTSIA